MSGLEPIMTAASGGLGALSTLGGLQQASAQRNAQAARLAQQQRQAALRQRMEERKLERQRRKETAAARARLGSAGVGSSGGSGAAVLRGLNSRYDTALSDSRTLFQMNRSASTNLLDDGGSQIADIAQKGQKVMDSALGLYRTGQTFVGLIQD